MNLPEPIILIYGKEEKRLQRLKSKFTDKGTEISVCSRNDELRDHLGRDVYDLIFLLCKKSREDICDFVRFARENNPVSSICVIGEFSDMDNCDPDYLLSYSDIDNERYFSCIYNHARHKKNQAELSAMLIHDLRSPLQSLMSYLELIENEVFGEINDGQHKMISHALSLSEDMQGLLEELSKIYQYEQKSFVFAMEKTPLKSLLDMVLPALWVLADKKNIKFNPQIINDLPVVNIDSQAIYRVLINLVSNAINHSPENSIVRLNVQLIEKNGEPSFVQFKVIDSGKGIDAREINYIFNKFYRVKDDNVKKGGYGLGLYISRLIIEAHKGSINAYNNREGGMTFYFTLPIVDREKENSPAN